MSIVTITSLNSGCGIDNCKKDLFVGNFETNLINLIKCIYDKNKDVPELSTIQIDFIVNLALVCSSNLTNIEKETEKEKKKKKEQDRYFFQELEKFCKQFVVFSYQRLINSFIGAKEKPTLEDKYNKYTVARNKFDNILKDYVEILKSMNSRKLSKKLDEEKYLLNIINYDGIGLIVYDICLILGYLNEFRKYKKANTSLVDIVNLISDYNSYSGIFSYNKFGTKGNLHELYVKDLNYEKGSNCDANNRYIGTILSILKKNNRIFRDKSGSGDLLSAKNEIDYMITVSEKVGEVGHIYCGLRLFRIDDSSKNLSDYLLIESTYDYNIELNDLLDDKKLTKEFVTNLFLKVVNYSQNKLIDDKDAFNKELFSSYIKKHVRIQKVILTKNSELIL